MIYRVFVCLVWLAAASLSCRATGINDDKKRAEEIRQLMWNNNDKDFAVTQTPGKWDNKGAVIIAKTVTLSFRKSVIAANVNYDNFVHNRIKLLDKKALERYAQFSIPENGSYAGTRYSFYAGFKIIKPDGREVPVPVEQAVLEKRELNKARLNLYKLAIPNLEVGDILDYYVAEEQDISISGLKYHNFDPVIFKLHAEYPVMKQKIAFEVLRKCYINLKSLNDAPEFKLTEGAEKNQYLLEDSDRESADDIRWLFPYRELPTVKFKVVYASNGVAGALPVFLGRPGVLKSDVSEKEVKDLVTYMFNSYVNTSMDYASLKKTMKKKFKKVKDKDKLARAAFYQLRYATRLSGAETDMLFRNAEVNPTTGRLKSLAALSEYYRSKKIPHEVLIGVSRNISGLDDLILENELDFMLKVNTPSPFYIGGFDNFAIPGDIDTDLQGQTMYSANGLMPRSGWLLKKVQIPVTTDRENSTETVHTLKVTDLEAGTMELGIAKSFSGASKRYYQNTLMDLYSYLFEEEVENDRWKGNSRYEKKVRKYRADYYAGRDEKLAKVLEHITGENLQDITVEKVEDMEVVQTGRFDTKPEFKYTCRATVKDVIKKAGPNYLVDIGKFIEGQVQITSEERERSHNVYMPYARSFTYRIEFEIPQGYSAQGIDKLNVSVENETGGFTSAARMEGGTLIIETTKYYKSNYETKERWPRIVDFLDAAYSFSQAQILLKRA